MAEDAVVILEATPSEETFAPIEDEAKAEELSEILAQEEQNALQAKSKKKRLLILASVGAILLLVIVVVIVVLVFFKKEPIAQPIAPIVEEKVIPKPPFAPSKLEPMIQKANLLYERGNKDEALKIYEQIATFNEAISYYNIGVAKMREKNFSEALDSFKKAIQNREQRCISAINASVCALEMNDKNLFNYYIDLAFAYLPEESNAPLYSYYVGLVHYYKNHYYEALSALSNPTNAYYKEDQAYLSAKILSALNYTDTARKQLEYIEKEDDSLTLGLLHAKLGEFQKAKSYLLKALQIKREDTRIKMALSLVENRLGNLGNTASLMSEVFKVSEPHTKPVYKIQSMLKPSLFDVQKAQLEFEKELFSNNENIYSIVFYYAPYKVFDAKQTIDYIRKGSMNIFIDEIAPALSYLKASSTISKVNIAISKGIKKALDFHIYEANHIFAQMVETYKNHSILHYNLALTYAQMGNYALAYQHFSKSYHLDNANHLAGVFALMCGTIIGKDVTKLSEDVKESIDKNSALGKDNLYTSLIHLTDGNDLSLTKWLEKEDKEETPLALILDTVAAYKLANEKMYRLGSQKLLALLPKDIMANIVAFHVNHKDEEIKRYAKAIQTEFNTLVLDYDAFYFGPKIVKEQYIKLLQIGGLVYQKRDQVRRKMEEEREDVVSIMQTLAYMEIYANQFEEAFTLYNTLMDEFNQKDTHTIFLASVAAIGAGHTENAIALLELSKLIDEGNVESRYALGLLYQEVGNHEAAAAQYRKIGNIGFVSEYFSFNLVR